MTATLDRIRNATRGRDLPPVSASGWSARIAIFAAALVVSAAVLHRLAGLMTPAALNIFLLAFTLAGLALLLAFVALWQVWRTARYGATGAFVAIFLAAAVLAWPVSYLPAVLASQPLNDVSTDLTAPPRFVALARLRPRGANAPDYPGVKYAQRQAELYPDIRPLKINRPPREVFELLRQAMRRLQIKVVASKPPERLEPGQIEGVDRTLILGFRDDVVLRVSAAANGARVDVRSASRWGRYDFGQNATRVRQILRAIVQRLQLTVPSSDQRSQTGRKRRRTTQ